MKIKKIKLSDLSQYVHPSAKLFRYLELKATYDLVSKINFTQPSLDLGCGDGYLSSLIFDDKFSYGLDNNEAGDVAVAKKKKRYKKILVEFAENMSLKDNSLNFVFSNSVLEHIPDLDSVLKEVSRVTKSGGKFLFTTPSYNFSNYLYLSEKLDKLGLGFISKLYIKKRNKMLNHYHLYTLKQWETKLAKYGFVLKKHSFCVSKEALQLWDKMAIEVFIKRMFDSNAEDKALKKYLKKLDELFLKEKSSLKTGADFVIYAVKK